MGCLVMMSAMAGDEAEFAERCQQTGSCSIRVGWQVKLAGEAGKLAKFVSAYPPVVGCTNRSASDAPPLMNANIRGVLFEVFECDYVPTAVGQICSLHDPGDLGCPRDVLGQLEEAMRSLPPTRDRCCQLARLRRAIAAIDATESFNAIADDPDDSTLRFTTDFVTGNWALAFVVDEIVHPPPPESAAAADGEESAAAADGCDAAVHGGGDGAGQPVRMLEVGAFEGRSAWLWRRLLTAAGSSIVCVDLWPGYSDLADPRSGLPPTLGTSTHELFRHNTAALAADGFLEGVLAGEPSRRALRRLPVAPPPSLGGGIGGGEGGGDAARTRTEFELIYIDGSHAKDDVLADIVLCDELLAEGGLLLLDDAEVRTERLDL
jgi:hypothetical protein